MNALRSAWPAAALAGLLALAGLASLGGASSRVGTVSGAQSARSGRLDPCVSGNSTDRGGRGKKDSCGELKHRKIVVGRTSASPAFKLLFFAAMGGIGIYLVALGVALLIGLFGAGTLIRVRRRPRDRPADVADEFGGDVPGSTSGRRLGQAVEAGLADLDEEGDPRRAVIAAWLRLEQAAAAAGTRREPAETPAELAQRVLRAHDVTPVTLARLADLYRAARYSRHDVDGQMRIEARRALQRLQREITAAVS
ncbi:MAG: DUF4129 domain-containing protein [Actinomycetota bacterium]|nr:DUF4129 domain-containing protein [Actinomycetota bacterium]